MKLSKNQLVPVKKTHSNFVFAAPEGMKDCSDLNVTKFKDQIVSIWKLKSFRERLSFLMKGEITLIISGTGMPPVSLMNGDAIEVEK